MLYSDGDGDFYYTKHNYTL